ncbi:very-long-chain enoyl-CoA reductase-like isoform X1 [Alosa sapidissima]|uniref:very-long-chain enoyl-CoA reductase-like isoform X1 n=1 Tax=Alosa sapidissima TaxID=34773 RepID=UPI001C082C10|nr:very-long-chain enoyl-CoA reductase-like isoform X1 [Alosa sapidissima]
MASFELRDLFTVAQFIKARCQHGLKAETAKADKNYIFYEVEIRDARTKGKLCFLDKVEPSATVADMKSLIHKSYPRWYPSRQALMLHPVSDFCCRVPEGKALRDDEILVDLPVGTTATIFFQDRGPQLGWAMVFLVECIGPLLIYLLFYYRLPYIYGWEYKFTPSPHKVVRLACVCHCFHYTKKLLETIFLHHFSQGTMSLKNITKNCLYYCGLTAWQAYYINHPLYTPPSYGLLQVICAFAGFLVCEIGSFSTHLVLNRLKCSKSRPTEIPYPTRNPFTWLFFFVSCPNYTYEVGACVSFAVMTQCLPAALASFLGFVQMVLWARVKHRAYIHEFPNYPELRTAIIPLVL